MQLDRLLLCLMTTSFSYYLIYSLLPLTKQTWHGTEKSREKHKDRGLRGGEESLFLIVLVKRTRGRVVRQLHAKFSSTEW
jgi:hypothetical protein